MKRSWSCTAILRGHSCSWHGPPRILGRRSSKARYGDAPGRALGQIRLARFMVCAHSFAACAMRFFEFFPEGEQPHGRVDYLRKATTRGWRSEEALHQLNGPAEVMRAPTFAKFGLRSGHEHGRSPRLVPG